ncbi:methyltransferase domain-containing protein [bacterium]|jgi:tRNA (guanine-N7-)-methyltransferase|nr:methyltransferase domain-containing protein [bacterium]MBT6293795.1 methyltransferase domain-containing protein [bacterium]
MARKKLIRFKEALEFDNVYALEKLSDFKFAKGYKKKILEIGCGHGLFSLEYAKNNPDTFVLGIDVKLDRIFKGANIGIQEGLKNLYFFRCPVVFLKDHLKNIKFDEIWITFPDPHSKLSGIKKRLTFDFCLNIYKSLLTDSGYVYLKTDSVLMYNYTLFQINKYNLNFTDFTFVNEYPISYDFKTVFEMKYLNLGKKIKRLKFNLKNFKLK